MTFKTEQELYETFTRSSYIKQISQIDDYQSVMLPEQKGLFGIPDLIVANLDIKTGSIIQSYAFELKLANWKRALGQAYRYKSFANVAYVVIDHAHLEPALRNIDRFKKSAIGLISIDTLGNIDRHFEPPLEEPFTPYLIQKFQSILLEASPIQTLRTSKNNKVLSAASFLH